MKRRANVRVLTDRYPGDAEYGPCPGGWKRCTGCRAGATLHSPPHRCARRQRPKGPAWSRRSRRTTRPSSPTRRTTDSGINSLTLHLLLRHLGGEADSTVIDNLSGGVLWASLSAQKRDPKDYWARASHAEWCALLKPKASVQREYRSAVAAAQRDRFALESTRETLTLLRDLQFRPDETAAALEVVDREIARLEPRFVPRQVLLFSGHMVDAPDRPTPRFPAAKLAPAGAALQQALAQLGAGPEDLALAQGAAGGDLLFLEACRQRGVRCQVQLPLPEPDSSSARSCPRRAATSGATAFTQ